jgi:hypothetical protein
MENQEFVGQKIDELKIVLKRKEIPKIDIGPHCSDPYPCDFIDHCWSHIPEVSIFNIAGLFTKKKFELYSNGIIRFEDVEGHDLLNEKQHQQVTYYLNKQNHINKRAIKEFLKDIKFPLYFLDFETFNPAVPLYNQSRPYHQIPFQYSLHYLEKKASSPKHFEFLAGTSGDPRVEFIEKLLSDTSAPGDILTYNQSFETGRLNELANSFPKYSKEINKRIKRIKDLMKPFQQRLFYTHSMQGSYSIKQVLPALVPELNYEDLPINNGNDASLAFMRMILDNGNDHTELRKHMLDYCRMDTWAMVKIFEKLNSI